MQAPDSNDENKKQFLIDFLFGIYRKLLPENKTLTIGITNPILAKEFETDAILNNFLSKLESESILSTVYHLSSTALFEVVFTDESIAKATAKKVYVSFVYNEDAEFYNKLKRSASNYQYVSAYDESQSAASSNIPA